MNFDKLFNKWWAVAALALVAWMILAYLQGAS